MKLVTYDDGKVGRVEGEEIVRQRHLVPGDPAHQRCAFGTRESGER